MNDFQLKIVCAPGIYLTMSMQMSHVKVIKLVWLVSFINFILSLVTIKDKILQNNKWSRSSNDKKEVQIM